MALPNFNNYTNIRPIIDELVKEINEKNQLPCITALELLSNVTALKKENAIFLSSIGLLDLTYELFKKTIYNSDDGLIHSGFIIIYFLFYIFFLACFRFFGYLTQSDPNALISYPLFSNEVFDTVYHFDCVDAVRRQFAFETLAIITTSSETKKFLTLPNCLFYNLKKKKTLLKFFRSI